MVELDNEIKKEKHSIMVYEKHFTDEDGRIFIMCVKVRVNEETKKGEVLDAWKIYIDEFSNDIYTC